MYRGTAPTRTTGVSGSVDRAGSNAVPLSGTGSVAAAAAAAAAAAHVAGASGAALTGAPSVANRSAMAHHHPHHAFAPPGAAAQSIPLASMTASTRAELGAKACMEDLSDFIARDAGGAHDQHDRINGAGPDDSSDMPAWYTLPQWLRYVFDVMGLGNPAAVRSYISTSAGIETLEEEVNRRPRKPWLDALSLPDNVSEKAVLAMLEVNALWTGTLKGRTYERNFRFLPGDRQIVLEFVGSQHPDSEFTTRAHPTPGRPSKLPRLSHPKSSPTPSISPGKDGSGRRPELRLSPEQEEKLLMSAMKSFSAALPASAFGLDGSPCGWSLGWASEGHDLQDRSLRVVCSLGLCRGTRLKVGIKAGSGSSVYANIQNAKNHLTKCIERTTLSLPPPESYHDASRGPAHDSHNLDGAL